MTISILFTMNKRSVVKRFSGWAVLSINSLCAYFYCSYSLCSIRTQVIDNFLIIIFGSGIRSTLWAVCYCSYVGVLELESGAIRTCRIGHHQSAHQNDGNFRLSGWLTCHGKQFWRKYSYYSVLLGYRGRSRNVGLGGFLVKSRSVEYHDYNDPSRWAFSRHETLHLLW